MVTGVGERRDRRRQRRANCRGSCSALSPARSKKRSIARPSSYRRSPCRPVVSTVLVTRALPASQLSLSGARQPRRGTMWATEMSTRRRMVGEVAGPQFSWPAIALVGGTNAATRMVGPLLGPIVFGWLEMKGAFPPALVQLAGAFALAGLPHPAADGRLDLARIPAEIAEGLALRLDQTHHPAGMGITVVARPFAFAYSGLVAPLGISAPSNLAGPRQNAGGSRAGRALCRGGAPIASRHRAHGPASSPSPAARRCSWWHLIVMAPPPSCWLALAAAGAGRLRHRRPSVTCRPR